MVLPAQQIAQIILALAFSPLSLLLQPLMLSAAEYMPWAARVEPTNEKNTKTSFRACNAFMADQRCLGTPSVSAMLNVEFEEW